MHQKEIKTFLRQRHVCQMGKSSKKNAQVNTKRKGAMEMAKVVTEKVKKDADKHKEA